MFTISFLFSMNFIDQSTEELKLKYLKPFVWTFTSFTLVFTLINLLNFLFMLIKVCCVCCGKCLEKKPPERPKVTFEFKR